MLDWARLDQVLAKPGLQGWAWHTSYGLASGTVQGLGPAYKAMA